MSDIEPTVQRELEYGKMIKSRLRYDSSTGALIWKDTGQNAIKNFRSSKGSEVIVDGVKVSAARLVWMWHWGIMPPCRLRHKNGFSNDTRIENLGFYDKRGAIRGAGFKWGVCVPDRSGLYEVAYFDSYYSAYVNSESVRRTYLALTSTRYGRTGRPKVQNVSSPWTKHVFREGEWEARDLV